MPLHFLVRPALALLVLAVPAAARADTLGEKPAISVTGEGTAGARPDMALLTAGVTSQAAAARDALDSNSKATAEVVARFKAEGIEDRDIQTADFSLQPVYVYPQNGEQTPPRLTGYTVTNTVTVRVRDLAKLGAVMDKAVSAGANTVNGIQFTVSRQSELLDEARKAAVADARRKAELYAAAAGVKLGAVARITETAARETPVPQVMFRRQADAAAPVPVEAGENTLHVEINVTFAID
ncbi:SIMPL domain-containing protein [Labrys wisconsinensis]|uniref:Uncharacterized protein YggE n=1 Tax=Labrys wisconsinensis TaxID=425677 RepID=A0ABU0JFA6_9HYPH|nr:SIMPL domain-containing protein [Labrys wisconsinensis]MDQ0472958.1 uncharacterized protein YggE [Labrys wisconsinensis]